MSAAAVAPLGEVGALRRVKFPFTPRHDDEIQVQFNDIVKLVDVESGPSGWVEVEHCGKRGKIPIEYLLTTNEEHYGAKGVADFAFAHPTEPDSGQFLKFSAGDEVLVLERPPSGWCVGIVNQHLGLFPERYVSFKSQSKFNEIEELLTTFDSTNLAVTRALCSAIEISSVEAVARDLILIYERHNKVQELIETVILYEVDQTPNEGTLFRKNSLSSHLMTQYARLMSSEYCRKTLQPLINFAINSKSLEIDPHKMDMKEKVEENVGLLSKACQIFLTDLMESISIFPIALRKMCLTLQQAVVKKFPSAKRKVIGGFYFLRLICPAVVSPDGFGVVESVDQPTRRRLILISKILQTLSNEVKFGVKEPYMEPMNAFITANVDNCHFILDKLVCVHPDAQPERLPELETEEYHQLCSRLHVQLARSKNKFCRLLSEQHDYSSTDIATIADKIVRLGPTPMMVKATQPKLTSTGSTSNTGSGGGSASGGTGSMSNLTGAAGASGQPRPDSTALDKRVKQRNQRDEEKRLKEEKKLKEKEKKIREKEASKKREEPAAAPTGTVLVESYLSKKQNGVISWRKRYFVLYSNSTKIYAFNGPEEMPSGFNSTIELAPSFLVSPFGKTKVGWEFSLRTIEGREHNFFTPNESDMRQWVSCLDRKLKEIAMPEDDKRMKKQLLESMEAKMLAYQEDRRATKLRLATLLNDPEKSEIEKNHLEELMVCIDALARSIEMARGSSRT